jgi:multidrug efflux pump subunit AcrA (membrane-fusion protein)
MLPIKEDAAALLVPTNVLLFRPDGTLVATVDSKGKVHLNTVHLGTDYGNSVAIMSGLQPTDHIILNPPDSLSDGDSVMVVEKSDRKEGT